jgi:hypothetical protein
MWARLILALAGIAFVGSVEQSRDETEMRWRFPIPSKWRALWGSMGERQITKAIVEFKKRNFVEISWWVRENGHRYGTCISTTFRFDGKSGFPRIQSGHGGYGVIRVKGGRLRLDMPLSLTRWRRMYPKKQLILFLTRAK